METKVSTGLRGAVSKLLRDKEVLLERHLREVRTARQVLAETKDPAELTFEVTIDSLWHGEKNVRSSGKGPLDRFLERAVKKYLTLNARDDVQAKWAVYVKIGRGMRAQRIPLPDEYVRSFFQVGRRDLSQS